MIDTATIRRYSADPMAFFGDVVPPSRRPVSIVLDAGASRVPGSRRALPTRPGTSPTAAYAWLLD